MQLKHLLLQEAVRAKRVVVVKECTTTNLADLTKAAHAPAAEPGRAYPVDLPAGCALRETEGVHCILHCCAPNLNPNKPNALDGDDAAARGKQMLAATYKALFSLFKQKCAA